MSTFLSFKDASVTRERELNPDELILDTTVGKVSTVQLDGLVLLKVLKHCRESLPDLVSGLLLGLVKDENLEVTHSFPYSGSTETDEAEGLQYQMDMMRLLREVNVDHVQVGWYQSTHLDSSLNYQLLETQFNIQKEIEESVVLIYDSLRTSQGTLSLKAYRVTSQFMELFKDKELKSELLRENHFSHEDVFEEVPITIHNSSLVNALLMELEEMNPDESFDRADLTTTGLLERKLELMLERIEDLNQEQSKFQNYQRALAKFQHHISSQLQRRKIENEKRIKAGEKPISEDDIINNPNNRVPVPPSYIHSLLAANQISNYTRQVNQSASHSLGKLFVAEKLQK